MKISPLAQASGQPGQQLGSVEIGRTATPMKLERARAIARGEKVPEQSADPQAERIQQNVRSIKMRTNHSPNREDELSLEEDIATEDAVSTIPESSEQAVVEATQPLSPQFAALAKQKRALQLERAEFDKQKVELESLRGKKSAEDLITELQSNPLRVLQEHGVTYDKLTEAILSGSSGISPEFQELQAKYKSLEESIEKKFVDRDTQGEQAALAEMRKEADRLAKEGEVFELVRETQSVPKVIDLIHRTYKETGEVLDVQDAMQLVEDELLKDSLKFAAFKKVQSKISAPPVEELQPQQPQQRQMRTLTARDTAVPTMSRRARAIAAANGTLKR